MGWEALGPEALGPEALGLRVQGPLRCQFCIAHHLQGRTMPDVLSAEAAKGIEGAYTIVIGFVSLISFSVPASVEALELDGLSKICARTRTKATAPCASLNHCVKACEQVGLTFRPRLLHGGQRYDFLGQHAEQQERAGPSGF